jgi:hypothetical protein
MRLGTHKYGNIVSFEMEDTIFPVNPLEVKSLVGFISKCTFIQRIIEVVEFMYDLIKGL